MLDAGDGTWPRFTSLDLRWQVLDCRNRCIAVGEAAVGDYVQRLALQVFLEVAIVATLGLDERLGRSLGAGTQDLHHVIARFLPGVPAAVAAATGCRLLDRLGGRLGHGDLGRCWCRLGWCNRLGRLGCDRFWCRRNRLRLRLYRLGRRRGYRLGRYRCRARRHTLRRCDGGHGWRRVAWLQGGITGRAALFTLTHARGLGQRLAHHRLRLANQRQRHRLGRTRELDGRVATIGLALAKRQLGLGGRRFGRRLVTFLRHQHRGRNGDHNHSGQREHMFFRHLEPHGWSLDRRTAGDHGFDQSVTGDLVDVARPAVGVFMDIDDLFTAEHLDAPASTFQALLQVLAGFFFTVGGELDDVEAFFLDIELVQPGNQ
ncbi:hypothetical protein D3C79_674190 [compost metagenome]